MKYILDTQTIIWFSEGNKKISELCNKIITDINNICYISVASVWEMAVKIKINKLSLNISLNEFIEELQKQHFSFLKINFRHAASISELELHHRDPFDRIIIAQAKVENIPIISNDKKFDAYPITRIW